FPCEVGCDTHSHNGGGVFRPATAFAFLRPTDVLCMHTQSPPGIKHTSAFRPMEFVSRARQHIHRHRFHIHRKLAHCLRCIRMQHHSLIETGCPVFLPHTLNDIHQCLDRLQHTRFVIRPLNAHQCGACMR